MINIETLVKLIQVRVNNSDNNYIPSIESALVSAWGIIASMKRWHFLKSASGFDITFEPNKTEYELKSDMVNLFGDVLNSSGGLMASYKDNHDFQIIVDRVGTNTLDHPVVFTDIGKSSGHYMLKFFPNPLTEQTGTLQYYEAGVLANIDKCPNYGIKALIHGALSLLSPPNKYIDNAGRTFWSAVTYKEDLMFEKWLNFMVEKDDLKRDYTPEYHIDNLDYDRIEEVNES